MRLKLGLLTMALVLVVTSGSALAATREGGQELGVGFTFTNIDEFNSYVIQVNLGYFVTQEIEVRLAVTGVILDADGDTATTVFLSLDGLYHFMVEEQAVPYVGAGALMNWTKFDGDDDSDIDETYFGVKGILGVKIFLDENTSVNAEYNFVKIFDSDAEDADMDIIHFFLISLSYYF